MADGNTSLVPSELARYSPLQHLSEEGIAELSRQLVVEAHPPETVILAKDKSTQASIYLLSGEVLLLSSFGMRKKVVGPCLQPLHTIMPEIATITSKTHITSFRVEPTQYRDILTRFPKRVSIQLPGQKGQGPRRQNGESELAAHFKAALEAGQVKLPEISSAVLKITVLAQNPDAKPKEFADLLNGDQVIADRLIQVANSPQYRGNKSAFSVVEAVSRIGFAVTRNLVLCGAMKQLFKVTDLAIKKHVLESAQTSIRVAAIGSVLADSTKIVDPDTALLAGLIHDIGAQAACQFAATHRNLQWQSEELDELILRFRATLNEQTILGWGLETAFVTAARDWSNPNRRPESEKADLCDIVAVARAIADHAPGRDAPDLLPAYRRLGLAPCSSSGKVPLMDEKRSQVQQVTDVLRG